MKKTFKKFWTSVTYGWTKGDYILVIGFVVLVVLGYGALAWAESLYVG